MKYVEVFVKDNTLFLQLENNVNIHGDMVVTISVETLNNIDLSGACKINVDNIETDNFTVDVSGACKGTFSGNVKNLNLDLSGATKLNTVALKAKNLNIDMSGASRLEVYCNNSLTVDASGASKITVYGDPQKTKTDFSGASSVKFK
jgi:nicotinate-nucleotide pyrophosphorylase